MAKRIIKFALQKVGTLNYADSEQTDEDRDILAAVMAETIKDLGITQSSS